MSVLVDLLGLKNNYGVRFAVYIAKKSNFSMKLKSVILILLLSNE